MKTKRLPTAIIAGMMMCCMAAPVAVGAATNNSEEAVTYESHTANQSAACNVNATVASSFTVEIPKTITLDGGSKTATYNVKAKGDIAGNEYISVAPASSFAMKQDGKADVTATITQNKTKFRASGYSGAAAEDELKLESDVGTYATTQGSISATDLTSGEWAGTFDFAIGLTAE